MTIAGEGMVAGQIINGFIEREHDEGLQVNASWEVDQLTSGLCAFSQSVLRIMSCCPMFET